MRKVVKKRRSFCGECLQELRHEHWLKPQLHLDGTLICRGRVSVYCGKPIEFEVDVVTARAIDESGLDPRKHEYWVHHPASDGNKGWKTWRGKKHELGD